MWQYGNDTRSGYRSRRGHTTKSHSLISSGITYNMYADKLLGTNLIPKSVFDMRQLLRYTLSPVFH